MFKVFREISRRSLLKSIYRRYDQKVVEYFENPPNVGSLDKSKPNVGTCLLKSNCWFCGLWRSIEISSGSRRRWKN